MQYMYCGTEKQEQIIIFSNFLEILQKNQLFFTQKRTVKIGNGYESHSI